MAKKRNRDSPSSRDSVVIENRKRFFDAMQINFATGWLHQTKTGIILNVDWTTIQPSLVQTPIQTQNHGMIQYGIIYQYGAW